MRFFPFEKYGNAEKQKKITVVSRETPEGSRGSRGRNVLDPELTQDYISQVSEEIEGRVTKKLSKEFNKTESRILGALSKLDEFLLNPKLRTCSVVQGASSNANPENRETHGDLSLKDSYPEVGYFSQHSGQLNSLETGTKPAPGDKKLLSHGDRSYRKDSSQSSHNYSFSRRNSLLLSYNFVRQTEEGALHKSTSISQREYPCDN